MEFQLRRHQIERGKMPEFVGAWKKGVVPLRRQFGFEFYGAWLIEDADEFVWIVGHDHSEGFDTADRDYYESAERAALSPDPAQYITAADHRGAIRVL